MFSVCLATLPEFHYYAPPDDCPEAPDVDLLPTFRPVKSLFNLGNACNVFFAIEIGVGLIVAPSIAEYCRSPTNFIDIISVVPYFILLIIRSADTKCRINRTGINETLEILRLLLIFRFFRVMNRFRPLRILVRVIVETRHELLAIASFFGLSVLFYGTVMYYAEKSSPDTLITTIPMSLYWAAVTLVPVCYGDTYPKAVAGCITCFFCFMTGYALLTLTIPVLCDSFKFHFDHIESQREMIERREEEARIRRHTAFVVGGHNGDGEGVTASGVARTLVHGSAWFVKGGARLTVGGVTAGLHKTGRATKWMLDKVTQGKVRFDEDKGDEDGHGQGEDGAGGSGSGSNERAIIEKEGSTAPLTESEKDAAAMDENENKDKVISDITDFRFWKTAASALGKKLGVHTASSTQYLDQLLLQQHIEQQEMVVEVVEEDTNRRRSHDVFGRPSTDLPGRALTTSQSRNADADDDRASRSSETTWHHQLMQKTSDIGRHLFDRSAQQQREGTSKTTAAATVATTPTALTVSATVQGENGQLVLRRPGVDSVGSSTSLKTDDAAGSERGGPKRHARSSVNNKSVRSAEVESVRSHESLRASFPEAIPEAIPEDGERRSTARLQPKPK